ncbi:DUF2184 domain-containing protein [Burkholderia ambifaria]|jgi:hypothetical protein|uniref:DUF2184 domain-containing protein n=1 Tax=Burkholderia ambifaria TaxID=152480 RepID=UPI00158F1C63|nr:DUF2184 domain-containing protein [Burkholderia ambifaria]
MANYFPAQAKVAPSFSEPELIVTYAQASGAFSLLQGGKPRVKIGSEDLFVYINALDLRTETQASQGAPNLLPSATLTATYYSTATYLIRTRAQWDHHDTAAAAAYSIGLPAAQDLAQRQGIFQQGRVGLLYGFNPANGEGLMNTVGATAVTLPPDSYGNTTVSTYDNGEMALWILAQIVALKTRMFQSGGNIRNKIRILSPQRVFLQLTYGSIVQVVQYQRPGAGTATVGQIVQTVAEENGDEIEWAFDDTLIGKGAGGSDAVILTIPEIEKPDIPGINTNVFADVNPNMKAVNLMYADAAAPIKIPTPIPDGGITEVQELRVTSGWGVRPEGITILSMPH